MRNSMNVTPTYELAVCELITSCSVCICNTKITWQYMVIICLCFMKVWQGWGAKKAVQKIEKNCCKMIWPDAIWATWMLGISGMLAGNFYSNSFFRGGCSKTCHLFSSAHYRVHSVPWRCWFFLTVGKNLLHKSHFHFWETQTSLECLQKTRWVNEKLKVLFNSSGSTSGSIVVVVVVAVGFRTYCRCCWRYLKHTWIMLNERKY